MAPAGDSHDEALHYFRCSACGAWVDMRDLNQVIEHEHAAIPATIFGGWRRVAPATPDPGAGH